MHQGLTAKFQQGNICLLHGGSRLAFQRPFPSQSVGICCTVARAGKGFFSLPVENIKSFCSLLASHSTSQFEIHGKSVF